MDIETIKATLYKLESLMYGYNFEVSFGIEIFENCVSYEDFATQLKTLFPGARPLETLPLTVSREEFWHDLLECLEYRGDNAAQLILDEFQVKALKEEQTKYLQFIEKYLSLATHIYSYPDSKGIPGYPVFWDYRYIIFCKDGRALFTHGACSD
jgi:hypothetical protein